MNFMFGANGTDAFKKALEETFAEFNAMPAAELFAIGEKHSNGVIAGLISACTNGPQVKNVQEVKLDFHVAVETVYLEISFEQRLENSCAYRKVSAGSPVRLASRPISNFAITASAPCLAA